MPAGPVLDRVAPALFLAMAATPAAAAPGEAPPPSFSSVAEAHSACCGVVLRPSGMIQYDVSLRDAPDSGNASEPAVQGNLRRAQIGFEGEAGEALRFSFTYDFGGPVGERKSRLNSVWLQWPVVGPVEMRAGIFAPPGGLEGPSEGLLLFERAAPPAVVRSIVGVSSRPAVGLFGRGQSWTASLVLNGDSIYARAERGQRTVSVRVAAAIVESDALLVHAGVASAIVLRTRATEGSGGAGTIRLSERGELRTGARLVDTGLLEADGARTMTFELGVQWRRWLFQGEYARFVVDRVGRGFPDARHGGGYIQVGRVLRGPARRYARGGGSFAAPFPEPGRGGGVWELAARYSWLDLDHALGSPGTPAGLGEVRGGRQQVLSLGANWYASAAVRFQAMVQRVAIDRLSITGDVLDRAAHVASLRAQYVF